MATITPGNIIIDPQHPYPGLYPFIEEYMDYFFGREREINDLADLIENNVLTIIFGKSGIGKTSLLRAGLIPQLRDNFYLPIYLHINFGNMVNTPIDQVKEEIDSQIKRLDREADSFEDLTLWEYFGKVEILSGLVTPLLFFDQFEEIFTIGKSNLEKVNEFVTEITDLIENRVPVAVQRRVGKKKEMFLYSSRESNFRVIFSLREDYLPQLKNLSRYMPSIVNGRYHYRVRQMKEEDAMDAVLKPGKEIIKDPAVAEEIVKKIPGSKEDDFSPYEEQSKKIEPFLLSLFCYQVNKRRLDANSGEITIGLLEDIKAEDIVEDYYKENVDPVLRTALEDQLLTADGHRKLQDINSFKKEYHIREEDINKLVDIRIIRRETRTGTDYIELSHDVLVPILKESRDKRKQEEKILVEKKKRERELEEKNRALKRRRNIIVSITMMLFVLAILTWYAFEQRAIAEKESRNNKVYEVAARSANLLDKDPIVSFRLAEYAYNKERTNPGGYNALLKAYYNPKFYSTVLGKKTREFRPESQTADFFAVFCPHKEKLRFVTVSSDQLILWEGNKIEEIKDIKSLRNHLGLRPKAACSPDGRYFAFLTRKDNEIGLWELDGEKIELIPLEVGINSVAFSSDSGEILTGNRDNTARLWGLDGTPRKPVFKGHTQEVSSAVFSPKGKYVVTASWDKTVRLWDRDGKEIKKFEGHEFGFNSAVLSPDKEYLVTANNDSKARLWDLNGKVLQVFDGHSGAVLSAVFSPDGNYIITGSDDNTARLWDLNGNQVFKFEGFNENIYTASFSPDGKYVLIAPARGPAQLRLIDPEEIIGIVKGKGIRSLTEGEEKAHNL